MAVQYNSKDNTWSGIVVDIKNAITNSKKQLSTESLDLFSIFNNDGKKDEILDHKKFDEWCDSVKIASSTEKDFLKTWDGSGDIAEAYQAHLKNSANSMTLFQRVTKTAGSALKTLGATLGSMAVNWAIGEVISLIATGIDNAVHKVEYAQERLDDFNDKVKETKDTLSSQEEWISENGDTYAKLSKGVDEYGHNVSLTTDEFKQYNDITSKIAEMFPDMVSGYNEQNKAIIKNKGSVEALTKAYEDSKKAKYADVLANSSETYDDYKDVVSEAIDQREKLNSLISSNEITGIAESDGSYRTKIGNQYLDSFLQNSLSDDDYSKYIEEVRNLISERAASGLNTATFTFDDLSSQLQGKIRATLQVANTTISTETAKVKPLLESYLYGDNGSDFNKLSNEGQQAITNVINSLDDSFYNNFDSDTELFAFFKTNFINPLKDGINDADLAIKINTLFSMDKSDYDNYSDYVNAVLALIEKIRSATDQNGNKIFTDEQVNNMKTALSVGDMNSDGELSGNALINKVSDKYKNIQGSDKIIKSLNEEELRYVAGLESEVDTYDKLTNAVKKYREEQNKSSSKKKQNFSDSFDSAWSSLKKSDKKSLKKSAIDGTFDKETISSFESLKTLADNFSLEKVRKEILNLVGLDDKIGQFLDDTDKLTSAFQEMQNNGIVSTKTLQGMPDGLRNLEGYTKFRNTVVDPKASKDTKKGAFEDLLSEYLTTNETFKNVTTKTKNYVISALKDVGIVNAEELVDTQINVNNASKNIESEIDKMTKAVMEMSDNDRDNFIKNLNQKGLRNTDLYNKIGKSTNEIVKSLGNEYQTDVNNFINSVESKIKAQNELNKAISKSWSLEADARIQSTSRTSNDVKGTGSTGRGAFTYNKNSKEYKEWEKQQKKVDETRKKLKKAKKEADKNLKQIQADYQVQQAKLEKLKYDPSTSSSNNNSSSNSSGSKTTQQVDWIDRKITTITKKIDILKTKYDALFNNGKIKNSTDLLNAQNKNIEQQIKKLEKLQSVYGKAATKYKGIAEKYFKKVDSKYANLVKNGGYSIENFTTSDTTKSTKKSKKKSKKVKVTKSQYDSIQKAIEYWDKYQDAGQNKVSTATDIKSKKQDHLQKQQEFQESVASKWSAKQEYGSLNSRKKAMDKEWEWRKKSYETQIASAKLDKDTAKVAQLQAEMANAEVDYKVKKLQADQQDKDTLLSQLKTEEELATLGDANKSIDKQIKTTKESYDLQVQIAKEQGNTAEAAKLEKEEQKAIVDLLKEKVDNVQSYYEAVTGLIDNDQKDIQNQMDILEARGITITADYYKGLNQLESGKKSELETELNELKNSLNNFAEGTQAWYDVQDRIQSVQDSIAESDKAIVENTNAIREATDKLYEKAYSYADNIISESDFLTKLVRGEDTDSDTGKLTDAGLAKLYNAIFSKEANDANIKLAGSKLNEIQSIVDNYESGKINLEQAQKEALKLNYTSYEKMKDALPDLRNQYQGYISNSNDYLDTIVDLVKSGMEEMKNHMSDMVDAHKDAMNKEKELYDYQKSILEKTKTITDIEKQISAIRGDDSEEGRLRLSQLQSQLDDAKTDLQDTEYDKYISDQQEMLDNMMDEYEDILTTLQKDENYLIQQGYKLVNGNTEKIKDVINENASKWGYIPSPDYTKETAKVNETNPFTFDYEKITNSTTGISKSIYDAQVGIIDAINKTGGEAGTPSTDNTSGKGNGIGSDSNGSTVSDQEISEINKDAENNHKDRADSWKGSIISGTNNTHGVTEGYVDQAQKIVQEQNLTAILKKSSGKEDITKPLRPVKSGETFNSDLNKQLSKYGYVVKTGKGSGGIDYIKMFAIALGLSGSDGSYSKTGNVYSALKSKYPYCGFRTGGIAELKPKGEDGIAWVRNKEGFVAPENVKDIQELLSVLPPITSFLDNNINKTLPSSNIGNIASSYNINIGDIKMDGVNDPDAFAKQLVSAVQNKSNVQRVLQGATTNQMLNKSKLGMNRII